MTRKTGKQCQRRQKDIVKEDRQTVGGRQKDSVNEDRKTLSSTTETQRQGRQKDGGRKTDG